MTISQRYIENYNYSVLKFLEIKKWDKSIIFRLVPRGDPAEARTQDPQIKSLLLYQLSYGVHNAKVSATDYNVNGFFVFFAVRFPATGSFPLNNYDSRFSCCLSAVDLSSVTPAFQ